MSIDCLKLTTYFGEHDRVGGRFLADELLDVYERHALRVSVLLRGVEGFGVHHRLQTERLLSLSEDLPVVGVAVDSRARVEAALEEVTAMFGHGLITLERARLGLDGAALSGPTKLTVYVGRKERAMGRPAYVAIVELLRAHRLAGATVLLGVDGTMDGVRRRARFFGRNADVPLMIVAVGDPEPVAAALSALRRLLPRAVATLEKVTICKRDGVRLATPPEVVGVDEHGLGIWQKLMVHSGEAARFDGHPLHVALIRRLREAGAAGATALRGVWGYTGAGRPHGDRFWSLRRHVPVATVIVDSPDRVARWFEVVDEVTGEAGLVTCEVVPALRASGPGVAVGGLRLARPR
jgi:PII-like signaling protein